MPDAKVTCIGFEQPPVGSIPGYADELHRKLSRRLGPDLLSDDPGRAQARSGPGAAGPIYVQSDYPSGSNDQEQGLSRLGRWNPQRTAIDTTGAPLVDDAHRDRGGS